MEVGGGGGGGGGQEVVPCSNLFLWHTNSECNKFYPPFEIADKFFLVNLVGIVKIH